MNITALIEKLEAARAAHGDLPVAFVDYGKHGGLFDGVRELSVEHLEFWDSASYETPCRGKSTVPVLVLRD